MQLTRKTNLVLWILERKIKRDGSASQLVLCIYGKINNSAYNHRDASFNHRDASYNRQGARFNHRGTKCSSLYYELCVNLGAWHKSTKTALL